MIVLLKRQRELTEAVVTTIHEESVEIVESYLGTTFDDQLKFDHNTKVILKKCLQQQYFLRKLDSSGVSKNTYIYNILFSSFFIESTITFSLTCWLHYITAKQKPAVWCAQALLWDHRSSFEISLHHVFNGL